MMKLYARPSRDFAVWCLILALPYYLLVPFLLQMAGASWHFQLTAWGKTHDLDLFAVFSLVLFGYSAFVTFPGHYAKKSVESSTETNTPRSSP